MKKILTTCGYCGCGCNFYLNVEDNEVVGISPKNDHSVSRGQLCIKGWQGHSFVHHKDRLTTPLIRKEDGTFRPASWEEAYALIGTKFSEIRDNYGGASIGVIGSARCTNEENYLITKLARSVFHTGSIDHCARLCHSPSVAALQDTLGSGAMTNSSNELEHADVILVIGSNTTEQHPMIGMRLVIAAKQKRTKIIVIDPRKIPLAEYATIHAPIEPGTNLAILNALLHVIVNEGLVNQEFIDAHTEGYEAFLDSIREYTPEAMSEICGVSPDTIREIARLYATADRATIVFGMGVTQHITGTRNVGALSNLALITGHIGKKSTGLNPLRGQNNVQGSSDMAVTPTALPGYQSLVDPEVAERFARYWGPDFSREKGRTLGEILDGAMDGSTRAMFVVADNLMLSEANLHHTEEALEHLEFLVVQDIFLTETAKHAHVVLPGASFMEKDGTFTNTERLVQRIRKALEPIGDSRPDWKILCEIFQAMGVPTDYQSPEEIMEEIRQVIPIYGGITYERIAQKGLQWPCPTLDHPGTGYLHKDGNFTRGRGKFTVNQFEASAQKRTEEYPFILTTGRIQHHYHTGTMTRRSWALDREFPHGFMELHPQDAEGLGLRHGSKVKVSSTHGEIQTQVKITENIRTGVVFVPFHFAESAVNLLIGPQHDPVVRIPEFKVCAVNIQGVK